MPLEEELGSGPRRQPWQNEGPGPGGRTEVLMSQRVIHILLVACWHEEANPRWGRGWVIETLSKEQLAIQRRVYSLGPTLLPCGMSPEARADPDRHPGRVPARWYPGHNHVTLKRHHCTTGCSKCHSIPIVVEITRWACMCGWGWGGSVFQWPTSPPPEAWQLLRPRPVAHRCTAIHANSSLG